MPPPVLIVGQGIAGSALGWACEQAGIDFEIADAGHGPAASRVGAGILNPVTGRRLAPTWGFDAWIGQSVALYRAMEAEVGRPLIRPMRIYRRFRDAAERAALSARWSPWEVAPAHVGPRDADGFWIEDVWQVDTAAVLAELRARWLRSGRLRIGAASAASVAAEAARRDVIILCGGAEVADAFDFVPWERAAGEILSGMTTGLDPGVILHRGHWVLPLGVDRARVGATYEVSAGEARPTPAGRAELAQTARELLAPDGFTVTGHEAGVRLGTKDRRPCIGRHPTTPGLGLLGGLGSKGALWAPALARQWVNHLTEAVPFDREVDVGRFFRPCCADEAR